MCVGVAQFITHHLIFIVCCSSETSVYVGMVKQLHMNVDCAIIWGHELHVSGQPTVRVPLDYTHMQVDQATMHTVATW